MRAGESVANFSTLRARSPRPVGFKFIIKYPNIRRIPSGGDLLPNLQHPENPVPLLDPNKPPPLYAGATGAHHAGSVASDHGELLRVLVERL
jgi:hypothetical protein